jgi:hypothetical protein
MFAAVRRPDIRIFMAALASFNKSEAADACATVAPTETRWRGWNDISPNTELMMQVDVAKEILWERSVAEGVAADQKRFGEGWGWTRDERKYTSLTDKMLQSGMERTLAHERTNCMPIASKANLRQVAGWEFAPWVMSSKTALKTEPFLRGIPTRAWKLF